MAVGCVAQTEAPATATAHAPSTAEVGFNEAAQFPDEAYALLSPFRVIWLGEMHGTKEAPELLLGLVRLMGRRDGPPVVGLEFPTEDQDAIDEFFRTGDHDILRKRTFFRWPTKDGRSSEAMAALLEALRREKIAKVVCFVGGSSDDQKHEENMAVNLTKAANAFPKAKLLVLSGSVHSRMIVGVPWNSQLRPAAHELMNRMGDVCSLRQVCEGGTFWAMVGNEPGRSHQNGGYVWTGKQQCFISVGEMRNDGHRGVIFSRRTTASPPW